MATFEADGLVRDGTLTGASIADRSIMVSDFAQLGHPDQPNSTMVVPFLIHKDCSAVTISVPIITSVPFALKIVDVIVQCIGANALGTAMVYNGTNAITDAIISAVNKVVTRAGTIDATYSTVAALGSMKVVKNAAADKALVTIVAVRV